MLSPPHLQSRSIARSIALCLVAACLGADIDARAQQIPLRRLPPVEPQQPVDGANVFGTATVPPPVMSTIHPVQYYTGAGDPFDSAMAYPQEPSSVAAVVPLHRSRTTDAKEGVLQRAAIEAAWLAPSGGDEVGLTELSAGLTLGAPLAGGAILLSPLYTLSLFDGPGAVDIPSDLHGLSLTIKYFRQFTEGVGAAVWVTPGLYSDFEAANSEAFRLSGGAVATLQRTATAKWILGVMYLNRANVGLLPAVGLIWTPSDTVRFDLVFPRPEAKWMFLDVQGVEWWAFIAAELGGNTWAYQQTDGDDDQLSYRDYRITLGVERHGLYDIKSRFEVGYVFGRELETDTPSLTVDLDDTVMLRGGLVY
ncbi:MAG: hypothetical protein KDA63_09435 [Planctomycetales bacterium]|nr:hypothetical protein [Planctomycetales bacterium]